MCWREIPAIFAARRRGRAWGRPGGKSHFFRFPAPRAWSARLARCGVVGTGSGAKSRAIPEAVQQLRHRLPDRFRFSDWESDAAACRHVVEQARLASTNLAPVTLAGERGTGKRTLARTIHYGGITSGRAFLAVDCAGLPGPAAELLLFGDCGLGRAERVGTILLRDPEHLPRDLQERLLAWIGKQPEKSPRFIATVEGGMGLGASNSQLMDELRLTLSLQAIQLIPLRERLDDLPRLVASMLRRLEQFGDQKTNGMSEEAVEFARAYPWPDNLHELQAVVGRAILASEGGVIAPEHLPESLRRDASRVASASATPLPPDAARTPLDEVLGRVERRLIIQAMARARGLHETAAELLGIWRTRLGRRLKALKIEEHEWRPFVPPEPADDAAPPDHHV